MNIGYIFLIIGGCIVGLIILLLILGRVSASSKGINNFKKRVADIKAQPQQETADEGAQVDFGRPRKTKGASITNYDELDDDDKRVLGIKIEQKPEVKEEPVEKTRKSFDEIMRKREQMKAAAFEEDFSDDDNNQAAQEDDFEQFRQKHSSYTPYQKDDALIAEIKGLSPQAKKVLFSSLFQRIDRD